jgi:hypothetical protein
LEVRNAKKIIPFILLTLLQLMAADPARGSLLDSCSRFFNRIWESPAAAQFDREIDASIRTYESGLRELTDKRELRAQQLWLLELWNQQARRGKGYQTTPMRERYVGEHWADRQVRGDLRFVRYFSEEERAALEVGVGADGLLRRADGSLLTTCTPSVAAARQCTLAISIYVMEANGRIFRV